MTPPIAPAPELTAVRRHWVVLQALMTLTTLSVLVVSANLVSNEGTASRPGRWVLLVVMLAGGLLPLQYWLIWGPARGPARWVARADAAEHNVDVALRTGGQCLWRTDQDGVIVEASGQSRQVFGYEPRELLDRSAADLLHPDDVDRTMAVLESPLTAEAGWSELWMHCVLPSGDDRWVVSSAFPVQDEHGRFAGFEGSSWVARGDKEAELRRQATWRRVRAMVDRPELDIALQPIWDLTTGLVIGAEALTRFRTTPSRSPDRWFADAHAVGLGPELELLCLGRAIETARALPEPHYLSLNVSPAVAADGRLLDALASARHLAGRIVVEITEHESIEDYDSLREPLRRLRSAGARIAVDDAGSGFASFSHIVRLRPEIIKLDRTLVSGIDDDAARRALAAAVVMFAIEIGATVVAEGVETQPEYETLCTLGLDAAQGYLLGRPSTDALEWAAWRTQDDAVAATVDIRTARA